MNADLAERLDEAPDTTVIPVIFQLNSPVTPHDRAFMANLGLNLMGEAPLLDAGLVEGKTIDVRRMSTWDRAEYLELDKPLEFFYLPSEWGGQPEPGIMMHETTHVVRATTRGTAPSSHHPARFYAKSTFPSASGTATAPPLSTSTPA